MRTDVVPEYHHDEMKRKALEAELLAARKDELDAADAKQRKRILKDIEKTVREKLKDESILASSRFLIR